MLKLRPSILVALSTSVKGGSVSERTVLEVQQDGSEEREISRTVKTVFDRAEHQRACSVRAEARAIFERVSRRTAFGLMVEGEREPDLREAARQAEALVADFNDGSRHSKVHLAWLPARIDEGGGAQDAVAAIRAEVGSLLESLEEATRGGDVGALRDLANRATVMGRLLTEDSPGASELGAAVTEARRVASAVVRRVGKLGEDRATVLAEANLATINVARFAFLGRPQRAPEGAEGGEVQCPT